MEKTLIADSGSTKTDWVVADRAHGCSVVSATFTSHGLNPRVLSASEIEKEMRRVSSVCGGSFDRIRFFGAGVGDQEMADIIERCLGSVFQCDDVKAFSDMAGAAVAVLGKSPGVACIMGTGSNSCHYDGNGIDMKTASLGYLIDDNGGGVAFGRRLLRDVFKKVAPADICEEFHRRYSLSVSDVVARIYKGAAPNRWMAEFMPFVSELRKHPYMEKMINSQLDLFFDLEFAVYPDIILKQEGIGFAGSVAYSLSDEIASGLERRGWSLRDIVAKPMDNLKYLTII